MSRQAGVLDGIPVTLIGGDHFTLEGVCPRYGRTMASSRSAVRWRKALAQSAATATRLTFPNVHSIFFADALGLPWERV